MATDSLMRNNPKIPANSISVSNRGKKQNTVNQFIIHRSTRPASSMSWIEMIRCQFENECRSLGSFEMRFPVGSEMGLRVPVGLGFRWLMAHANHLGFSGRHVTCICLELSTCVFCFFNIKPPTRDNSVAFCSVSGYSPAIEPRVTIKILIKTEFNLWNFIACSKMKKELYLSWLEYLKQSSIRPRTVLFCW